jgi:hypothetical protein
MPEGVDAMKVEQILVATAAAAALACAAPCWAEPRATVLEGDLNDPRCDYWGDSLTLIVKDGDREIVSMDYCSSYGIGEATVVADALARNYVLLRRARDRGTNAATHILTVYQLTDRLLECARVVVSQPVWPRSRWFYDYSVETPPSGGLRLRMTLRVEGEALEPEYTPPRRRVADIRPPCRGATPIALRAMDGGAG